MEKVIEIENLHKSFKDVHAVNGLSFSVYEGQLFAFLGINGAGKSTTISIICGQLQADSGSVKVNGTDINADARSVKRDLGVVFQNSALDKQLTVLDNLKYRAALYGINGEKFKTRLEELSALLDLQPILKRTLGKLSGGQKRRVDIARALVHSPKILILDEPTTGLDPQTRKNIWEVIGTLRKRDGVTVLLTTHYMEEAADADRVVIIDGGKIVAEGTPLELKNRYTGDFITVYGGDEEKIAALGVKYEKVAGAIRIAVKDSAEATELIVKYPELFTDYEVVKGKMDDVFLAVTGKNLVGGVI
ncbi:MAG: ABC transporter ATP-binding protein [Clostridiales bacterium]|nr:ABC transporter ATP-binding protein [Clostridiales bacterium]